ncbi:MAG TPA: site-2 protease family protein [Nitrososphaerales archaeon]|nr:site-2 protease family protein [Nitrososphaerales archaeon]
MSAINADVDAAVRSLFSVKDYFVAEEGAAEYSVVYGEKSAPNFLKLLEALNGSDYSAQLYGDPERATLVVVKNPPPPTPQLKVRLSTPAFLFLLALLSVLVTGYVVAAIFPQVSPGSSSLEMGVGFVAALAALFAARYLAQRYAAGRGRFSFLAYYLPNVPLFIALPTMYFLPTFGAVSFPTSPPANKNKLFDFYLVGAVAMLVVALAVSFLGAGTSVVLTHAQVTALSSGNQTATIQTNPSILQGGAISLSQNLGMLGQVPAGGTLIFSPIEIAAWLGLLLAFFNLMPAALFDGGRMGRLALGDRWIRATTIVSALFLLLTDLPDYWVAFLLVFLMAAFPVQGETLDSISGLSSSRKAVFAIMVALGVLCVPVPQAFATFTL